jgi:RimJ/RimL family protein N-acetyltransferase
MPLEGENVRLREERPEDMKLLVALRNDLETQAWSRTLPPDYTENMYMKRFAGTISYSGLEPRWSAVLGIMVPKKYWGSGVALEASEVLLMFLFQEIGVRVVRLYTHSGNPRAVKLAEKSGFRISMRQRQAIFKNGEMYDNLVMDLLREEYYVQHPELEDQLPACGET